MSECNHNRLVRDENAVDVYSCEACQALFVVESYDHERQADPQMGAPR